MDRIIIIDDKKCEKELSDFLEANKEHIRFNTTMNNFKSSTKDFFEELTTELVSDEKLAINSNQHFEIVHTRDITHVEDMGLQIRIYLINNKFIDAASKFDDFEKKLIGHNFIRIHDKFIINFNHFSKLNMGVTPAIALNNGATIPVNPNMLDQVLKYIIDIESNK